MTHCDHLTLSLHLDGELSLPDSEAVRKHLAICPDCAQQLEELRRVDRVLEVYGSKVLPLPAHTDTRVHRARERRRRLAPLFALGRMTPAAAGTGAAALLLFLTASMSTLLHSQQPTLSSTVATNSPKLLKVSQPLILQRRAPAVFGQHALGVAQTQRPKSLLNES